MGSRERQKEWKRNRLRRKKISPLHRFWWHPISLLSGCRLYTLSGGGKGSTKISFSGVYIVHGLGGNTPGTSPGWCNTGSGTFHESLTPSKRLQMSLTWAESIMILYEMNSLGLGMNTLGAPRRVFTAESSWKGAHWNDKKDCPT